MMEQAVAAFVQEARDLLTGLEDQILELEGGSTPGQIDEVFRILHTVKGSGGMFGYTDLAKFTHCFENAFELVRSGTLAVGPDLIELSLEARDLMVEFLDIGSDGPDSAALLASDRSAKLMARIEEITGGSGNALAPGAAEGAGGPAAGPAPMTRFEITFRPHKDALRNGMRPELLVRELEDLGETDIGFDLSQTPALSALEPGDACLGWHVDVMSDCGRSAIDDVFIFADEAALTISEEVLEPAAETGGSDLADAGSPAAGAKPAAPSQSPAAGRASESIRVASSRMDAMMDSLGELVIAQARLDAVSDSIGDTNLASVVEEVQRLVTGLRDATLSIRLLPIETVFSKFRRVVRDLSKELGKDVQLVAEGGDTEVDKTVIDRIGDPLAHLVRNAIDHGLETGEQRSAAGKNPRGTVRMSARQEGSEVLISVEDNGRGLDRDAIRAKAIEKGLLDEATDLSESEYYNLIFQPGFSTAAQLSSVSGRGVGMDAVRSMIDALGGSVDVVSRPGLGSRITLRLPVTMAIIEGLRVRLGESIYVIPLSTVEECVEMSAADMESRSGRMVLQIRDQMVPYLALDEIFGQPHSGQETRRVVIVRINGNEIGLVVDDIIGQGQTVIKSLSPYHRDIPGLGGATILGDGRVALILDVATLVRLALKRGGPTLSKAA
ncbi:chemotaxis protein CheA [Chachezhania antarctica]|uniref:chemotaxis protein CheA n=1 Tax=Chachezhania antarctica TaxID=2340860 RepID=UPI000EAEA9FB|nr:chemotaxis protein CheA [Chachezhania antarctica]